MRRRMADDIDKLCGRVALIRGERDGIAISEGEIADYLKKWEKCLVERIREIAE